MFQFLLASTVDACRRTVVNDQILDISEDVGVSLVQRPGHGGQTVVLCILVGSCWAGVEDEGYCKQTLDRGLAWKIFRCIQDTCIGG